MTAPIEPGSREAFAKASAGRHPSTVQIIRYFAWSHLPEPLRSVSQPVGLLALDMLLVLPDGPELTVGLRKLLEAKDCLVRHALDVGQGC